jgi:hypothetical protein
MLATDDGCSENVAGDHGYEEETGIQGAI